MCKFLENDAERLAQSSVSDGFCCSSGRFRMWCNAPPVTAHDIMLIYDPPLLYPDISAWLSGDNSSSYKWHLADAVRARSACDTPSLNGGESKTHAKNKIPNAHMPPSIVPRAVHVFGPAAATWHVRPECYHLARGRDGREQPHCEGAAEYMHVVRDASLHRDVASATERNASAAADAVACEVTAAFCARFVRAAASIRRATSLSARTTALYVCSHHCTVRCALVSCESHLQQSRCHVSQFMEYGIEPVVRCA